MNAAPSSPPKSRAGLQHGAERQRVLRPQVQNSEEDDAGERKALAEGLQELGRQELVRAPDRREIVGDHQAGDTDEDEPDGGRPASASVRLNIKPASGQKMSCGAAIHTRL